MMPQPIFAPPPADGRFEELSRRVTQKMAEHHIPGVGFGVVKDGQRHVSGFGVTNVEDPREVTPDTVFSLASISKTVTATAIMRLVEAGKIDLQAPVRRYLPGFRVQDEKASREVTVLNLLTHATGWQGEFRVDDRGMVDLEHLAQSLHQLASPGTIWSYDNPGYGVVGRLIEAVTGQSIHDTFREQVFVPLGLTRAFSRPVDIMTYRFTTGHTKKGDQTEVGRPYALFPIPTAGGVAMSVSDLLSYVEFHLGGGTEAQRSMLSRAGLKMMQTPQVRKHPTDDAYGIAWHLRWLNGVLTVAHGGTFNRHCLHIQFVPERNLGFVILTNHTDGWKLIQDVERATLKRYEGLALTPNQAIAWRGVSEATTAHVSALPVQPDPVGYLGTYRRAAVSYDIRQDGDSMVVATRNGPTTPIQFYAADLAFESASGPGYEFIRASDGNVGWIRVGSQIARKD